MGRPPKFDRETALSRATELFWKLGYVNTSVAELLKVMKLGEGSFYNAFKSKKALYVECLRHYNATFMMRRSQALNTDRPTKERIQDFFDVVLEDFEENKAPGCLISNSLSNEVLAERELKTYLFEGLGSFLDFLSNLIAEGQQHGEIAPSLKPHIAARILFTYLHGLQRLSVYEPDFDTRREQTRVFIDSVFFEAA